MTGQCELEEQLNSFDADERSAALDELAAGCGDPAAAGGANVNMHAHSFFSYNADGYSPSRIAWDARAVGLYAAGLCDFDVLDGLEEFLGAGLKLGLRTTVNLETRAFFKEYADVEISSPGEPGVTYIMGAGFARMPAEGGPQAAGLAGYRDRARERNLALVRRINARLQSMAIDYERDVVPLTPAGAATERHIVTAYINKAQSVHEHAAPVTTFWSGLLGRSTDETVELLADRPVFEEAVRAKLAKRGGIGYRQPSADTFPLVDDFIAWVRSCQAVPMITWLDGTSAGEADGHAMLECMREKGAAALNIIPDRNWNISDLKAREVKRDNLRAIVAAAAAMDLPVNIGTELNKPGLPFVDDLSGEVLAAYKETFLRGTRIMVGHTLLLRYAGYSYIGEQARADLAKTAARNDFFGAVGGLPPLTDNKAAELEDMGAEKALAWFRQKVANVSP